MIVSVNGLDGSGKSEQLNLLTLDSNNLFFLTKPLVQYSDRWPKLEGQSSATWWFEEVDVFELVSIISESLHNRLQDSKKDVISLWDRGVTMFKAVCVATYMTRKNIGLEEAVNWAFPLFNSEGMNDIECYEDIVIHLALEESYAGKIQYLRNVLDGPPQYSAENEVRYARYQRNLGLCLTHYQSFSKTSLCITVNEPILDIQNNIRGQLKSMLGLELPLLCEQVERILGIGGLSESGKSGLTCHLESEHGYSRIKIRALVERYLKRGVEKSDKKTALELVSFLSKHRQITMCTIESLRGPELSCYLKLLFGARFQTIYLEAPFELRIKREVIKKGVSYEEISEQVRLKDEEKLREGLEGTKLVTDLIIDNSSEFTSTVNKLLEFLKAC